MSKIYVVGTPIGNLKDITLRALETLKQVDVIACEDTRVTRKLLQNLAIKAPQLVAHHNNNERQSAAGLIKLAKQGQTIALVSDAGMPTISDPGFTLISQALAAKIPLEVIPGVSAVIMTAALANFDTFFKFEGFLKPKSGQRKNQIKRWAVGTHIVYVAPHNILKILDEIAEIHGPDVKVFVGRELTKKFETHYRGLVLEVKEQIITKLKGEFTLAVALKDQKC